MSTVLLTGASGFLGAHTLHRLLDEGHRVRAFVRTPGRLATAIAPLGLSPDDERIDVVTGDMTDTAAVREAVQGCDKVVHAAAVYSFRRRDRAAMQAGNAGGAKAVLGAAVDAGCEHVVHVSSTVALNEPGGSTISSSSPLGPGLGPYSDSKVASEAVARDYQERGAPVSIVNPGGVLGPHDPYLGESDKLVRDVLLGRTPLFPRGFLHYVDVRDTASTIVAALEAEPGGRYLVPGEGTDVVHRPLRRITGRRLPVVQVPVWVAVVGTTPGYLTGWGFLPGEREGGRLAGCGNPVDFSTTTATLGVGHRSLDEMLTDTVRWLVDAGHLPRKAAGALAG